MQNLHASRLTALISLSGRKRALIGALAVAGSLAAAPLAHATTPDNWTSTTSGSNWSDAASWDSGVPAAGSAVAFPTRCGSAQAGCDVTVDGDETTAGFTIDGSNGWKLSQGGSGGTLTLDQPTGTDAPPALNVTSTTSDENSVAFFDLPVNVDATHSVWDITGSNYPGAAAVFEDSVTGAGSVDVNLADDGGLFLGGSYLALGYPNNPLNDVETGPLTVTGTDNGTYGSGSVVLDDHVNDTSGSLTTFDNVSVSNAGEGGGFAPAAVTTGPLAFDGATVRVDAGTPIASTGTVSMNAANSLTVSTTGTSSTTPAISAAGSITLGGKLILQAPVAMDGSTPLCQVPTIGSTETLIQGGSVSGRFVDGSGKTIPDGGTVVYAQYCAVSAGGTPTAHADAYRINYTATTVTGTALAPTTTTLSVPSQEPLTNQSTTLTATVTSQSGSPDGTVSFADVYNGGTVAGCGSVPVVDGIATCQTPDLSGNIGFYDIEASFTPAGTTLEAPSQALQFFFVGPDPTTTSLSADHTSATSGQAVTLTASVRAQDPGTYAPTGEVEFEDSPSSTGHHDITCSNTANGTAQVGADGTATCVTSALARGAHSIVAEYDGDDNFDDSASNATALTVANAASPSTGTTPTTATTPAPAPAPPTVPAPVAAKPSPVVSATPLRTGAPNTYRLSASSTVIPAGTHATSYTWTRHGKVIGHGASLRYSFPVTHASHAYTVMVTVALDNGQSATSTISVTPRTHLVTVAAHLRLQFKVDSYRLTAADKRALSRVKPLIARTGTITITGYAALAPGHLHGQALHHLAAARAAAVRRFLFGSHPNRHGMRVRTVGNGGAFIASNRTAAGRGRNRSRIAISYQTIAGH